MAASWIGEQENKRLLTWTRTAHRQLATRTTEAALTATAIYSDSKIL